MTKMFDFWDAQSLMDLMFPHVSICFPAKARRQVLSSYAALQSFHPSSVINISEWFEWTPDKKTLAVDG